MNNRRALIVEDTLEDQNRIQLILDSRHIDYDTVNSALAAQTKLKQKSYLFIILDLDLGTGIDEGKFLLDTMFKEGIQRPTIIISHAGLLPDTIALKGRYDFVKESIDKKHLHSLLDVFDKTIRQFPNNGSVLDGKKSNPSLWIDLFPLLFSFIAIVSVIAVVSRFVSNLALGVVLIGSLLTFLAIAIFLLRRHDNLSENSLTKLIDSIIKSLPLLQRLTGGTNRRK